MDFSKIIFNDDANAQSNFNKLSPEAKIAFGQSIDKIPNDKVAIVYFSENGNPIITQTSGINIGNISAEGNFNVNFGPLRAKATGEVNGTIYNTNVGKSVGNIEKNAEASLGAQNATNYNASISAEVKLSAISADSTVTIISAKNGRTYEVSGDAKIGYLEGQISAGVGSKGGNLTVGGEAGAAKVKIEGKFTEKPDYAIDPLTGKLIVKQDSYFVKVNAKLYSVSYEQKVSAKGTKIETGKGSGIDKNKWDLSISQGKFNVSTPWFAAGYIQIDATGGVSYFQDLKEYYKLYEETLKKQIAFLKALQPQYVVYGPGTDLRGLNGLDLINQNLILLEGHAAKMKQALSDLNKNNATSVDVTKARNFKPQIYEDKTITARNNAKTSTNSFLSNVQSMI